MPTKDAETALVDVVLQQVETNRRLADRVLDLAQSLSKLAPVIERQGRTLYDLPQIVETQHAETLLLVRSYLEKAQESLDHAVELQQKTGERLAVISDNVKDAQRAAENTGQHRLVEKTPKDHPAVATMRAFGSMRPVTQVLLLIALLALAASGWLHQLVK